MYERKDIMAKTVLGNRKPVFDIEKLAREQNENIKKSGAANVPSATAKAKPEQVKKEILKERGTIVRPLPTVKTIPQSPAAPAPFTQGSRSGKEKNINARRRGLVPYSIQDREAEKKRTELIKAEVEQRKPTEVTVDKNTYTYTPSSQVVGHSSYGLKFDVSKMGDDFINTNSPFGDYRITSKTGARDTGIKGASKNHAGIDRAVPEGTVISLPMDTTFHASGYDKSRGFWIEVKDASGNILHYQHLMDYGRFGEGETLSAGTPIARSGSSGVGTAHLHEEYYSPDGRNITESYWAKYAGQSAEDIEKWKKEKENLGISVYKVDNPAFDVEPKTYKKRTILDDIFGKPDTYKYINDIDGYREKTDISYSAGASYNPIGKYAYLTTNEIAVYNKIYTTYGEKAAERYLENIDSRIMQRIAENSEKESERIGREHPVFASVSSVAFSPAYGLMGVIEQAKDTIDVAIGKDVDQYSFAKISAKSRDTMRNTVSKEYASKWFDETNLPIVGNAGEMAYGLLMSFGDMAMSMAVSGGNSAAASLTMAGNAMSSTVNNALENGYTDEQAVALGWISGASEMIFEKISIEKIMKPSGKVIGRILKSMAAEAQEEGVTELVNILADTFIAGENSDYERQINELVAKGVPEREAIKSVLLSYGGQVLAAGISGAIMGGGMSAAYSPIINSKLKKSGAEWRYVAEDIIQTGLDSPEKSIAYKNAKKLFDKGIDNVTNYELGLQRNYNIEQIAKEEKKANKKMTRENDVNTDNNSQDARFAIKTLSKGRKYVQAEEQVIKSANPDEWEGEIIDYVNRVVRKGQDVTFTTDDGEDITITGRTAWKLGDKGNYDDQLYFVKGNASGVIDEVISVSRGNDYKDPKKEHSNGFASQGFRYKTAFFRDLDGKYYRLNLSVGINTDGKEMYNIGKIEEVPFPVSGSKATTGTAPSMTSIYKNDGIVNNFLLNQESGKITTQEEFDADEDVKLVRFSVKKNNPYTYTNLVANEDMNVVKVSDNVPRTAEGKVDRNSIKTAGMQNAFAVGTKVNDHLAVVKNRYSGSDIAISWSRIGHSLDRRGAVSSIIPKMGEVVQNAIRVNEMLGGERNVETSYPMISIAKNEKGETIPVLLIINDTHNGNPELIDLGVSEVLYSANAKKENQLPRKNARTTAQKAVHITDSKISISNAIDVVKNYFPDVLSDDVLSRYGMSKNPDSKYTGVKYSVSDAQGNVEGDSKRQFGKTQKKFFDAFGVEVVMDESLDANAEVLLDDGVVKVSPYADIDDWKITRHEFTHLLKVLAPEAYELYARLAREEIGDRWDEYYAEAKRDYTAYYAKKGKEVTDELIEEEVLARYAEGLDNNDFIRKVARENTSIAVKIRNILKRIVDKIKAVFSSGERAGTPENIKKIITAKDAWENAAVEVARSKGKGSVIKADTSLFADSILRDNNKARAYLIEFYRKIKEKEIIVKSTGEKVRISRNGLDKFLSGNITREKYASGFHIPELISSSERITSADNYKGNENIPTYTYYQNKIDVDGNMYGVYIRVRNTNSGNVYYGHTISEIDDIKIEPLGRVYDNKSSYEPVMNPIDSTNSIYRNGENVNSKLSVPSSNKVQKLEMENAAIEAAKKKGRVVSGGSRESIRLTENDLGEYLHAGTRRNPSKQRALSEGKKIILCKESEITAFIRESIRDADKLNTIGYGRVNERLSSDVNLHSKGKVNIDGNFLELVPYDIHHAHREHLKAKEPGDIDLSMKDFENIPSYIDHYDEIVYVRQYESGNTRICLSKKLPNGRVLIIETVSKSRGSIAFKNMIGISEEKYNREYKKRNSTNTRGSKSSNISLHDETASKSIIHNESENVNSKFSVPSSNKVQKLESENAHLKEVNDILKRFFKQTAMVHVDALHISDYAEGIKKRYESHMPAKEIATELQRIYTKMAEDGARAESDAQKAEAANVGANALFELAGKILEQSDAVDRSMYDRYAELRHALRTDGISISESDARDIPDFNDFRRQNTGRVKITSNGTDIDSYYEELIELYPEFFASEEITAPSDKLLRIVKVRDMLDPKYRDVAYTDDEAAALAVEMYAEYFSDENAAFEQQSLAAMIKDRYAKSLRAEYNDKLKKTVDFYREQVEFYRNLNRNVEERIAEVPMGEVQRNGFVDTEIKKEFGWYESGLKDTGVKVVRRRSPSGKKDTVLLTFERPTREALRDNSDYNEIISRVKERIKQDWEEGKSGKTQFGYSRSNVWRSFRRFFGDRDYHKMKELVLDPLEDSKRQFMHIQEFYSQLIYKKVVKELGIKKGSELSALVQKYGEKTLTAEELEAISEEDMKKIQLADRLFRACYDGLIDTVNDTRRAIYPDADEKAQKLEDDILNIEKEIGLIELGFMTGDFTDVNGFNNYNLERIAIRQESAKELEYRIRLDAEKRAAAFDAKIQKVEIDLAATSNKTTKRYADLQERLAKYQAERAKWAAIAESRQAELQEKIAELNEEFRSNTEYYKQKLDKRLKRLNEKLGEKNALLQADEITYGRTIQKRKDYYRHFEDLASEVPVFFGYIQQMTQDKGKSVLEAAKEYFDRRSQKANIDNRLAGKSADTKPRAKWQSFAQHRTDGATALKYDAVGGFLEYLPAAAYSAAIDPQISIFRTIAEDLAAKVDGKNNNNNLGSFIGYLQEYANDLAGKTNPIDRVLVDSFMSRDSWNKLNWLTGRIKSNMIGFNVSSMFAQILNMPNAIATIKNPVYFIGAMRDVIVGLNSDGEIADRYKQSQFLNERYINYYSKFEGGFKGNARKVSDWMLQAFDELGGRVIWNAAYRKGLKLGEKSPVRYADDLTRRMIAGRGIGEMQLYQKSRLMGMILPFSVEVANNWDVIEDIARDAWEKASIKDGDKKYDFGVTQRDINSFVHKSYQKSNEKDYIKYLKTSKKLIGDMSAEVDVSKYVHAMRDNDIRHIKNSHGEETNEKYPVKEEDIALIPFIVQNYDKVFYKTNANNIGGIVYVKVMPNNVVYYVEAITTEYHNEKLLVNKQMVKTGINEIPNLRGLINAINKKQSSSQYLADLKKIREAYVQDVKENYSSNNISYDDQTVNKKDRVKGMGVPKQQRIGVKGFATAAGEGVLGLLLLFVANRLFNELLERLRGSDGGLLDPFGAIEEGIKNGDDISEILGSIAGDTIGATPAGTAAATLYPEQGIQIGEFVMPTRSKLFGANDPTRYGTGTLFSSALKKPVHYLLMPTGGAQLDKTLTGIKAFKEGAITKKNGDNLYEVDRNSANSVKGAIFGKSGFKETRDYYDKKDSGGIYDKYLKPRTGMKTEQFKELNRLIEIDDSIKPSKPGMSFVYNDVEYKPNGRYYDTYEKMYGRRASQYYNKLMLSSEYKAANDELKVDMVKDAFRAALSDAKAAYVKWIKSGAPKDGGMFEQSFESDFIGKKIVGNGDAAKSFSAEGFNKGKGYVEVQLGGETFILQGDAYNAYEQERYDEFCTKYAELGARTVKVKNTGKTKKEITEQNNKFAKSILGLVQSGELTKQDAKSCLAEYIAGEETEVPAVVEFIVGVKEGVTFKELPEERQAEKINELLKKVNSGKITKEELTKTIDNWKSGKSRFNVNITGDFNSLSEEQQEKVLNALNDKAKESAMAVVKESIK